MSNERSNLITSRPPGLVDVLDRILDKGLVVAGDIKVSLANVELLTIQIRLLVCSIDKAEQIGLDWWRHDSNLTARAQAAGIDGAGLRDRIAELELAVKRLSTPAAAKTNKPAKPDRQKTAGAAKKRRRRAQS